MWRAFLCHYVIMAKYYLPLLIYQDLLPPNKFGPSDAYMRLQTVPSSVQVKPFCLFGATTVLVYCHLDLQVTKMLSSKYRSFCFSRGMLLCTIKLRHNERDGISNHQPHGCLLKRLFRRRSRKTSKLRVTGLFAGNSPVTGEFPHKGPVTRKMFPFDDVIMHNWLLTWEGDTSDIWMTDHLIPFSFWLSEIRACTITCNRFMGCSY